MIIVFVGSIGRFPVGGHAWVDLQYILGLAGLGHEVFYLEDAGEESWVYHWEAETLVTDLDYPTSYIRSVLDPVGFGDRWIYRAGDVSRGMPLEDFRSVCSQADLLLIRGSPLELWRPEYSWARRRIFIDSDPGFNQMRHAEGARLLTETWQRCEQLFTIGQQLGLPDCPIPTVGRRWTKTVPPVDLTHWTLAEDHNATHFTTVMQWRSYEGVTYKGVHYGNKDKEFQEFIQLPSLVSQPFKILLTGGKPEQLAQLGWEIEVGWRASFTPDSYRDFIRRSRAEFGVAKHGYVATQGGWFSDRSACYLALGRPVLVQDTGLASWLPTGQGVLTFRNVQEVLRGIEAINEDYECHSRAARRIAEQYFAADRVLPPLLAAAME